MSLLFHIMSFIDIGGSVWLAALIDKQLSSLIFDNNNSWRHQGGRRRDGVSIHWSFCVLHELLHSFLLLLLTLAVNVSVLHFPESADSFVWSKCWDHRRLNLSVLGEVAKAIKKVFNSCLATARDVRTYSVQELLFPSCSSVQCRRD